MSPHNGRIAILCPGQGGQQPGMFDLALTSPVAAAALHDWGIARIVGMPLTELHRAPDLLYHNRIAQPLMVAGVMALWVGLRVALREALQEAAGPVATAPVLVAGYSVGELAAYAVAGALPAADAIRLAALRAEAMDDCVQPGQAQGLLAVSRVNRQALTSLLPPGELYLAIETGEDSFIVGGLRQALPALQDAVARSGGHTRELPVEVASHTPFMKEAARKFREDLERSPFSDPAVPVLSGIAAQAIHQRGEAIATLASQIEQTIHWSACMDAIAEAGVTLALELGPCDALARMLRERHPHIACRSVSEFRSIAGVEAWMIRSL